MKIAVIPSLLLLLFNSANAHALDEKQLGRMILPGKITVTNPYLDTCNTKSECGKFYGLYHPGIDFRARTPLIVVAPVAGTIVYTEKRGIEIEPQKDKTGTIVIKVSGKENAFFMFGHMSKSFVNVGDKVQVGCKIGLTGKKATIYPHLHVEYREEQNARPRLTPASKTIAGIETRGNSSPTNAVVKFVSYAEPTECQNN